MTDVEHKVKTRVHRSQRAAEEFIKTTNEASTQEQGIAPVLVVDQPSAPSTPLNTPADSSPELVQTQAPLATVQPVPPVPPLVPTATADNRTAQEIEQLRAQLLEREKAVAEMQEKVTKLSETQMSEEDRQAIAAYKESKRQQEIDNILRSSGVEVETMDPAVAHEIRQKIVAPVLEYSQKELSEIKAKQEAYERQLQEQEAKQTEAQKQAERQKFVERQNQAILSQHPDFQEIIKTDAYKNFIAQPSVPGSSVTIGELMGHEYYAGNSAYVIETLKRFKEQRPDISSIASVSPTLAGSQPLQQQQTPKYTYEDIKRTTTAYRQRRITRDEYNAQMDKYAEAGLL